MIFIFICILFMLFPNETFTGAKEGLDICISSIIPALLPFMIASSLVIKSGFARPLGCLFAPIFSKLFSISKNGAIAFITGLLGGYPVGANAVATLYSNKDISKREAERLLAFCNNSGPLFIICIVGISAFSSLRTGILLYITHILGAIVTGMVFREKTTQKNISFKEELRIYKQNKTPIAHLFNDVMKSSVNSILSVCGFIIFFSAIIHILPLSPYPIISGFIEMTSGVFSLPKIPSSIPIAALLIGFGGLSVHFQTMSIVADNDLSIKKYFLGKIISAVSSFIFCNIIINIFPYSVSTGSFNTAFYDPYVLLFMSLMFIIFASLFLCIAFLLFKE